MTELGGHLFFMCWTTSWRRVVRSTIGGRFGGALGIKVPLIHSGASRAFVATADYLTDVATIDHVSIPVNGSTRADFADPAL